MNASHSILAMEFSRTSFEVKTGLINRILKHGICAISRKKLGMINPLHFHIMVIEGRDEEGNALFHPLKKTFDKSKSSGK